MRLGDCGLRDLGIEGFRDLGIEGFGDWVRHKDQTLGQRLGGGCWGHILISDN